MMKEILRITSTENETLKRILKLKKRKIREEEALFLAEGRKFLDYPENCKYLFLREDISLSSEELERFSCPIYSLTEKCFQKISSQEHSQGIIMVYSYSPYNLDQIGKQVLILDDVQDPGNLGTIFRLADAAGFEDILLTEHCADVYHEKVVRSSMGSIFHIRSYCLPKEEIISFLEEKKYHCVVTSLEEDSIPYAEVKLEEKNAFIFGNEGHGVSKDFLELAAQKIIIPISGKAESLNVAMALGIIIFHLRDLKKIGK